MATISVYVSSRLSLQRFGWGRPIACDGNQSLTVKEGSTLREAIDRVGIPADQLAIPTINGHRPCSLDTRLTSGDRLILIPSNLAVLRRILSRQGQGISSGCGS